jgi:hypothetical protein
MEHSDVQHQKSILIHWGWRHNIPRREVVQMAMSWLGSSCCAIWSDEPRPGPDSKWTQLTDASYILFVFLHCSVCARPSLDAETSNSISLQFILPILLLLLLPLVLHLLLSLLSALLSLPFFVIYFFVSRFIFFLSIIVYRGPLSLVSTTGELLDRKVAAPV